MNTSGKRADSSWAVGVARRIITPGFHVELAGLGYYLNRTPERVRDDLTATAMVIEDAEGRCVAWVAVDLMYADEQFTRKIREQVASETSISPSAICVNCSHSHNAPTAAFARGVGELNTAYVDFAAQAAASAVIEAWQRRQPARLFVGCGEAKGMAFNRTRENGPVDSHLSVLRADSMDGKPIGVAVNFHCHLNAHLEMDLRAVSRDWAGEVVDQIEGAYPGSIAMYLQGTCGDVMIRPEFCATERRFEPAREIARVALQSCKDARPVNGNIAFVTQKIALPTRRWTRDEIDRDREEALYRLETGDTKDWLNGLAKVIVTYPDRLPRRYGGSVEKAVAAVSRFGAEWTGEILPHLNVRPESIDTEVQAFRVGDVWFVAQSSELFTSLGLEVRNRWPGELFMLGYSNGSLGYLPDAHDVEKRSYAATQSPKFTGQFPFTSVSGTAMVSGLLNALKSVS
ncbi:MAG TPA: hypothetical protein VFW05_06255 [Verrucomicrobiae bacterium]|nr:hypothetical protein [Verrucomicrobiae bacterium]